MEAEAGQAGRREDSRFVAMGSEGIFSLVLIPSYDVQMCHGISDS